MSRKKRFKHANETMHLVATSDISTAKRADLPSPRSHCRTEVRC